MNIYIKDKYLHEYSHEYLSMNIYISHNYLHKYLN